MLNIINRYCHGYTALSAVAVLNKAGFFNYLASNDGVDIETINTKFNANKGQLLVSLRLLQSISWINLDASGLYRKGDEFQFVSLVTEDVWPIYDLDSHSVLYDNSLAPLLHSCVARSVNSWGIQDQWVADFLDGTYMLPLLLGIRDHAGYFKQEKRIDKQNIATPIWASLTQLFSNKQWSTKSNDNSIYLSDPGAYLIDRMFIAGTVYSYAPMHRNMGELLLGDAASVFERNDEGHEGHVDRTLNVVASGFQHEKYFKDDIRKISVKNSKLFQMT